MSFRINARTILHLGSELISSDAIAIYELIKNAYDAGSLSVQVAVECRLPRRMQRSALEALAGAAQAGSKDGRLLERLKAECLAGVLPDAPGAGALRQRITEARTAAALAQAVRAANAVVVSDQGRGMSLRDLGESFLTIGTRSKLVEKAAADHGSRSILGEKGIGRLSAMRLGEQLEVRSATAVDRNWATLDIDWSAFDHGSDLELGDVAIAPRAGERKQPPEAKGTRITISALRREWTREYLEEMAESDIARLNDPFRSQARFPISLTFNGDPVTVPRVDKWIFDHAHAKLRARMIHDDGAPFLSGEMQYGRAAETFAYGPEALLSTSKATGLEVVRDIGPFDVEMLWYNRGLLTAMEGVGELATVRAKLARWTGGLMLFRDGFRVLPYGGSSDDWLDLDRKALARSGFKLNRAQIVGRVAITQRGNPRFQDQANREGLVDNEEKRAFVELLSHVVQQTFWSFLTKTERAIKAAEPVSGSDVEKRLEREEAQLGTNIALLMQRVPAVRSEPEVVAEITQGVAKLQEIMGDVRTMTREYEEGRRQLLNLAGVGLTVEILAHELNRAAAAALETLAGVPQKDMPLGLDRSLKVLAAQLKTLQKRLRVLDPLSTAGRNRKEKVDVVRLVAEVTGAHDEQFMREGVAKQVDVLPRTDSRLVVTVVQGMLVQVLENLVANSLYWLRQRKRVDPGFAPAIGVVVDAATREVRFSDNGPGIADAERDLVFDAFYTKKPSGEGKGLGLFICREIAKYHGAGLTLERGADGIYREFVLALGGVK